MALSTAEQLALLSEREQAEALAGLSERQLTHLAYDWSFWGRPEQQLPPGNWSIWLLLAGRGFGKTKTACEAIRQLICGDTPLAAGRYRYVAIVAETAADARKVVVEGQAGILAVHPADFRPSYEPSNRRLTWPNGAVAFTYNATEPDQLRGPQHDLALCDELAKWQYAQDTWDQLQFGMRVGEHPRQIIATTPRPIKIIRNLVAEPAVVVTRGSTYANRGNLAPNYLSRLIKRYEGTRFGRQELNAEILEDIPGALWLQSRVDETRAPVLDADGKKIARDFLRIVVSVDPAMTNTEDSDETGIIVAALGGDGDAYVLEDASGRYSPDGWAAKAISLYHAYRADVVVAEVNAGGDMVEQTLRAVDSTVSYLAVTASRGKIVRAEPVAALYMQPSENPRGPLVGRVHHVGFFERLEEQMTTFTHDHNRAKEGSPDRMDALVWAITELLLPDDDFDLGVYLKAFGHR
jgi:phage terminase large subunit-like protein